MKEILVKLTGSEDPTERAFRASHRLGGIINLTKLDLGQKRVTLAGGVSFTEQNTSYTGATAEEKQGEAGKPIPPPSHPTPPVSR